MKSFEINGHHIYRFAHFIDEMNEGFIRHLEGMPKWNGNLDALSDFVSWPSEKYQIVFKGSENISKVLSGIQRSQNEDQNIFELILQIFEEHSDTVTLIHE